MKKLSLSLLVFMFSFFGFSKSFAAPFTGYYLGVFAGGSYVEGTENVQLLRQFIPDDDNASVAVPGKHAIKSGSLIGMATLGYGEVFCNRGYLGGEFFVDWSNHKDTSYRSGINPDIDIFFFSSQVKIDPISYGFDVRPGYQICEPSLLYLRLGVVVKRVSINIDHNFAAQDGTNARPSSTSSKGVTRAFPRIGLGFEYALTDNVNLRADYIFTYLGNFSNVATASTNVANFVRSSASSSVHLVDNSFFFGICRYW